jgi:hypothetical protein
MKKNENKVLTRCVKPCNIIQVASEQHKPLRAESNLFVAKRQELQKSS